MNVSSTSSASTTVGRCSMRIRFLLIILAFIFPAAFLPFTVEAYRDYLTAEQKSQLEKLQTVLVEAIALTDKGTIDPSPITEVASRRLGELGYTVVRDSAKPHDATVKLKCEQRKTWEGTAVAGGDADLPDAPSRLWKGPACQLTYLLGDTKIKWQKEVRTDFEDAAT